jgi:dephospho-CoA kinase
MNRSRAPIIGLAGGIGAGKSAVAGALRDEGCVVVDSDAAGRAALKDPEVRATVVEWWGDDVLDTDGAIDRSAVARIVFRDLEQRRRLEALTHPWIESRRRAQFDAAPPGTPALVIDAPLLFEVGLDSECDAVIFVQTPRQTRLERLRATRGWDEDELVRREESQLPLDVKQSRADYVLRNDGDLNALVGQTRSILSEITESR